MTAVPVTVVFLGGGLGAALRYLLSLAMAGPRADAFPYPTLAINLLGALLIGILVEALALKFEASATLRLFLVTGILGGFTTYSAFALESVLLLERGAYGNLVLYIVASALGTIVLALLGMTAVRQVLA